MTGHQARAVRRNGPGRVWFAGCPEGCTLELSGKEGAEARAADHNALAEVRSITEGLTCECYYPDEMEYHPDYTCPRCRLLAVLGGAS